MDRPIDIGDGEIDRIRAEYARRQADLDSTRYEPSQPENVFIHQAVERCFVRALREADLLPLDDKRVLDVGCGMGQGLVDLVTWGGRPQMLAGIDLMEKRVQASRSRVGGADVRQGSATELPWKDSRFDLVFQVMLLSSVLDETMRRAVCAEMDRVLATSGKIISVDFFVDNPRNTSVRALRREDLAALFPGYRIRWRRGVLAPPLVRLLAPRAWWLASLLQAGRILDTHAVALITRA